MNKVSSIFSQILQFIPRLEFQAAVKKHQAERHARGFRCWDQFVAMMFCQQERYALRKLLPIRQSDDVIRTAELTAPGLGVQPNLILPNRLWRSYVPCFQSASWSVLANLDSSGIDPKAEMVIARYASHPVAGNAAINPTSLPAYHLLAKHLTVN